MEFRIGINLGDVIVEGEQSTGTESTSPHDWKAGRAGRDLHLGHGARDISGTSCPAVRRLGEQQVKNIAEPVRVWRVREGEEDENQKAEGKGQKTEKVVSRQFSVVSPQPPRRSRIALIIIGLLIAVGVLAFSFLSPFITHHSSLITQRLSENQVFGKPAVT